jgi:hypothetical protein
MEIAQSNSPSLENIYCYSDYSKGM